PGVMADRVWASRVGKNEGSSSWTAVRLWCSVAVAVQPVTTRRAPRRRMARSFTPFPRTRSMPHPRYSWGMQPTYVEEPCKSALNRVRGMAFPWSLNPYTGCVHRCTFCYVRAFERRADRPFDDRYGTTVRVKINVAPVLRQE